MSRLAGCHGKLPYKTHGEASRVVKRMLRRHGVKRTWCGKAKLVAYHCRCCGHYHVGNDAKEGSNGY